MVVARILIGCRDNKSCPNNLSTHTFASGRLLSPTTRNTSLGGLYHSLLEPGLQATMPATTTSNQSTVWQGTKTKSLRRLGRTSCDDAGPTPDRNARSPIQFTNLPHFPTVFVQNFSWSSFLARSTIVEFVAQFCFACRPGCQSPRAFHTTASHRCTDHLPLPRSNTKHYVRRKKILG